MLVSDLIAIASGSRNKINNSGERGSPCFAPLDMLKKDDTTQLVSTDAFGSA